MKFASVINDLVIKFVRLDELDEATEILVMERVYPMDFRAYEQERRVLWIEVLEDELIELHKAGFVHRDLLHPSDIGGQPFDNILLSEKGLRLIDVGISALKEQVGEKLFSRFVKQELEQLEKFKNYFLNR